MTADSAPPATITLASPSAISLPASPMAWAPVPDAVTTEWFGPLRLFAMETCPLNKLMSLPGMKNGEIRRGPFMCRVIDAS